MSRVAKQSRPAPGLDEWIAAVSQGRTGYEPAWKSWPPALLAEIAEVLRRNDAKQARVSMQAMIERAKAVHGVVATRCQMESAVVGHCGRRSWTRQ